MTNMFRFVWNYFLSSSGNATVTGAYTYGVHQRVQVTEYSWMEGNTSNSMGVTNDCIPLIKVQQGSINGGRPLWDIIDMTNVQELLKQPSYTPVFSGTVTMAWRCTSVRPKTRGLQVFLLISREQIYIFANNHINNHNNDDDADDKLKS